MKDGLNLDHLRSAGRGEVKDNSMPINVTRGMNEYGQAYTYGSEAAANARNDFSEQEDRNKNSEI